jgi:hypothetical protein
MMRNQEQNERRTAMDKVTATVVSRDVVDGALLMVLPIW